MKNYICLFFITLFLATTTSRASEANLSDRTEWFVDAINGDDIGGNGSVTKPFQTIKALLYVNYVLPESVGAGDTIFLAAGNYDAESVIIDIDGLKIEGASDESGTRASVLGDVKVTADGVTLSNCLFLDSEVILRGVKEVTIADNLFSGTTKNSLTLLGSSNNTIRGNRFESARESCVVLLCDPKSKQSSSENLFQANYFSHHLTKKTDQVILANKSSMLKSLFGKKKSASVGNRFVNCVFEEVTSGDLKQVVAGHFDWRLVDDFGYSLLFEDCYFKRADRRVPFISFIVISGKSKLKWFWDDLVNDTWVASNDGYGLTGHRKNEYTPSIRFVDADENGLILETEYPAGIGRSDNKVLSTVPSKQENSAPVIVNALADIALRENPEPSVINLFDLFEDAETADEDLKFAVSSDNTSIVSSELENGLLTLNYAKNAVGMATITITATDDDSDAPKASTDSFLVVIVEGIEIPLSKRSDWYVDSKEGNDMSGTGSRSNPFKTIEKLFAFFTEQPDAKGAGSTVHLSKGNYQSSALEINIPSLSVEGTLDRRGMPATILGTTIITASGVKLKNCKFLNASLTLLNAEDVLISNNVFSGETSIGLSLLGSSRNTIQHNLFESAVHESVYLYWDPKSGKTSNDNVFLRNYFTHRPQDVTERAIRVKWSAGNNNSISFKNRFIECAFEETQKGYLRRVIADDCTWWMVAYHGYSTAFEDCYFKRADREDPFSEFEILKGHPDFTWRWDELTNDTWVSTNNQWALTGDHNGWSHKPRVKFVDKNDNGTVLEVTHKAGLSSVGSKR